MNDEIKVLREEVAKLRERVAVLEAQQRAPVQTVPVSQPIWPSPIYPGYPIITC